MLVVVLKLVERKMLEVYENTDEEQVAGEKLYAQ